MKSSKGQGFSIRTVAIIVVVLLVLGALIVIFTDVWNPGSETIDCQAKVQSACANYVAQGCCEDGADCDFDAFEKCDVSEPKKVCC